MNLWKDEFKIIWDRQKTEDKVKEKKSITLRKKWIRIEPWY